MSKLQIPPVDYHIHTAYCGHADRAMNVKAVIQQAEEIGLSEIVLLEHFNGPKGQKVIDKIHRDVAKFEGSIRVLVGAECALAPKEPFRLEAFPDEADIVGFSIHHFPTTDVAHYDNPRFSGEEKEKIVSVWKHAVLEILRNYQIDIFCHPFFAMPVGGLISTFDPPFAAHFREIFDLMAKRDIAFELNDSMPRKISGEILVGYSSVVKEAKDAGVRFSLGSDAHALQHIGACSWVAGIAREVELSSEDFVRF